MDLTIREPINLSGVSVPLVADINPDVPTLDPTVTGTMVFKTIPEGMQMAQLPSSTEFEYGPAAGGILNLDGTY